MAALNGIDLVDLVLVAPVAITLRSVGTFAVWVLYIAFFLLCFIISFNGRLENGGCDHFLDFVKSLTAPVSSADESRPEGIATRSAVETATLDSAYNNADSTNPLLPI
ncbi:hypothetical protein PM082_000127 [Marasmius tenuissimus]|nr:hypothetical protein PM082_000127 [Marasmius tenuissimus]